MANFNKFNANDQMSAVRETINNNFDNAALKPVEKTAGDKAAIVGLMNPGEQKLIIAVDGLDYLSSATGVKKEGNQTIDGKLQTNELEITNNGAKVAKTFSVFNTTINGAPSFTVDSSKATIAYGSFEVRGLSSFKDKVTFSKGITSNSAENSLGRSTFSNVNASEGSIETFQSLNATFYNATVNTDLKVKGTATFDQNTTISGQLTVKKELMLPSPGKPNGWYARPMYITNRAPYNGEVQYGTLWGQY